MTEQFQHVSTRLNDLLTLMPAQHTVTLVPETPPANIRAHTPPFDEGILEETFTLPQTSTPVSSAVGTQIEHGSAEQFGVPMQRLLTLQNREFKIAGFL